MKQEILCPHCGTKYDSIGNMMENLGINPVYASLARYFQCSKCGKTAELKNVFFYTKTLEKIDRYNNVIGIISLLILIAWLVIVWSKWEDIETFTKILLTFGGVIAFILVPLFSAILFFRNIIDKGILVFISKFSGNADVIWAAKARIKNLEKKS